MFPLYHRVQRFTLLNTFCFHSATSCYLLLLALTRRYSRVQRRISPRRASTARLLRSYTAPFFI